jgi:hypothetical protein
MQHTTWIRRYIDGEGWYLDESVQSGRLPWEVVLTYGPFTYDELVDATEWVSFGYLEMKLRELYNNVGKHQEEEQQ